MIPIKNTHEIKQMREACEVAATVLERMCERVEEGMTTYDLDQCGKNLIEEMGATSACYNYKVGSKRYPAYTCISVNEEVVHGIGRLKKVLKAGDVLSIDVSVVYNGFVGDNAKTIILEPASEKVKNLVKATEEALYEGIKQARPENRVGDISFAIQDYIESRGFSIVRDFVGHGVGRSIHEEPQIPNYGKKGTGPKLKPGMTLAIEPMVNMGTFEVKFLEDGWTAVTRDSEPSAHFEHTILVTENEPEILTFPKKLAC